ncbi:hypothetical protein [Bradyrhizobium sp. UFLA03-84]|uniref:hypothetical protein n=1 Tax=Bradyrhizobium sp. UFLA03-84 TaxID=418599 RepID=UPI001303F4CC|nr:hypothetical protein [Bradyrhizobium sp. UFLA03-84]
MPVLRRPIGLAAVLSDSRIRTSRFSLHWLGVLPGRRQRRIADRFCAGHADAQQQASRADGRSSKSMKPPRPEKRLHEAIIKTEYVSARS